MTVLRACGVTAARSGRQVLHDVDLDVEDGDVVALLGPNGAGKSTLLDVLAGALKPTSGTVSTTGRIATALQGGELARRSAQANVELALAWWGVPRKDRPARARDALTGLRADHLADRSVTAMSGGERRRVHLARAIAVHADALLLDEPFVGLDSAARDVLMKDTLTTLRDRQQTVVVVVHDRSEAWALATRVVVLLNGRVAASGSPQHLLDAPPTPEVARFLGYTGELRAAGGLLMTRPRHTRITPNGSISATVVSRLPQEDRVLIDLQTDIGSCQAWADYPGPSVGAVIAVTLMGGVTFPAPADLD
ncbi:MAG: ABC transporter ATP-binding protein [Mycobacteriales bacterium]